MLATVAITALDWFQPAATAKDRKSAFAWFEDIVKLKVLGLGPVL